MKIIPNTLIDLYNITVKPFIYCAFQAPRNIIDSLYEQYLNLPLDIVINSKIIFLSSFMKFAKTPIKIICK